LGELNTLLITDRVIVLSFWIACFRSFLIRGTAFLYSPFPGRTFALELRSSGLCPTACVAIMIIKFANNDLYMATSVISNSDFYNLTTWGYWDKFYKNSGRCLSGHAKFVLSPLLQTSLTTVNLFL
jgi:hypothetical protein